jgi:hypothetical protein
MDSVSHEWWSANCAPDRPIVRWGNAPDFDHPDLPSRCYRILRCPICKELHRPGEPHGNAMRSERV